MTSKTFDQLHGDPSGAGKCDALNIFKLFRFDFGFERSLGGVFRQQGEGAAHGGKIFISYLGSIVRHRRSVLSQKLLFNRRHEAISYRR